MRGTIALCLVGLLCVASFAPATTMDDTDRWSWSTVAGWVNWEDQVAPVEQWGCMVDTGAGELQGYIWCESIGWIHLDPTNAGVTISDGDNDGIYECSGYAWSTVAGWINFDPTGSGGVTLNLNVGQLAFSGEAWGEAIGWIDLEGAAHATRPDATVPVGDWVLY